MVVCRETLPHLYAAIAIVFEVLDRIKRELRVRSVEFDPLALDGLEAAAVVKAAGEARRLLDAISMRASKRVNDCKTHAGTSSKSGPSTAAASPGPPRGKRNVTSRPRSGWKTCPTSRLRLRTAS
jgi:hypothetical protein